MKGRAVPRLKRKGVISVIGLNKTVFMMPTNSTTKEFFSSLPELVDRKLASHSTFTKLVGGTGCQGLEMTLHSMLDGHHHGHAGRRHRSWANALRRARVLLGSFVARHVLIQYRFLNRNCLSRASLLVRWIFLAVIFLGWSTRTTTTVFFSRSVA